MSAAPIRRGGGSASMAPTFRGQGCVGGSLPGVPKVSSPTISAATNSYLPKMVASMSSRLSGYASRVISNLRGELVDAKLEREALESTVLTLSAAVGSVGSITQSVLDQHLKLHDEAVNRCLDTIPQEMKGGASPSGVSGSPGGKRLWTGPISTSPQTPTSALGE